MTHKKVNTLTQSISQRCTPRFAVFVFTHDVFFGGVVSLWCLQLSYPVAIIYSTTWFKWNSTTTCPPHGARKGRVSPPNVTILLAPIYSSFRRTSEGLDACTAAYLPTRYAPPSVSHGPISTTIFKRKIKTSTDKRNTNKTEKAPHLIRRAHAKLTFFFRNKKKPIEHT